MNPDDLMPNDGTFFFASEPIDQAIERKKEKAKALEGMNHLEDMLTRLKERIDFYERRSSIPDDVRLDKDAFIIMDNTYAMLAEALTSEMVYLKSIVDAYKR